MGTILKTRLQWNMMIALAASIALGGSALAENGFFAGVTGLKAASSGTSQIIHFDADLPFEAQVQVLGENQVSLHLFNAQLSSDLAGPDGTLNFSGTGIERAVLKTGGSNPEIVLSGPGLGQKHLIVEGADLRPELKAAVSSISAPTVKQQAMTTAPKSSKGAKPVVVWPERKMDTPDEAVAMLNIETPQTGNPAVSPASSGIQTLDVGKATRPFYDPKIPVQQVRSGAIGATNTTIERSAARGFVMDPSVLSALQNPATAREALRKLGGPESIQPATNQVVDMSGGTAIPDMSPAMPVVSNQQPAPTFQPGLPGGGMILGPAMPEEPMAPEPTYSFIHSLPKYTGGAPPIKAVTLDNTGQAISLSPKNKRSVMEVEWGESGGLGSINPAVDLDSSSHVSQRMQQALTFFRQKKYTQAQQAIDEALALDSSNADLYAALGEIDVKLSKMVEAEKAYDQASRLNAGKYTKRYAELLILQNKRDEAVAFLKKALQTNSQQADLAFLLGTLFEEQGEHASALAYLEQAARLHPASGDIQYNLGLAYEFSGDKEKAEAHYQKAVELDPRAGDAKQALIRIKH